MLQADRTPDNLDVETIFSQSQQNDAMHQDIVNVLWRWKWLAIFGSLIGLGCGYLLFSRKEPTYQSSALVQVVYPSTEAAGLEAFDGPDGIRGHSRLDESMIIKSARVVDLAIEIGKLESQPQFESQSETEIRNWILEPSRLVVEPAGRDNSTALIEISFVCEDAELSRLVVDSVIAGYDNYLEQAYRNLGDEVARVVTQAQVTLRESYDALAAKHAKFRKDAPTIWLGDEARNQYAENSVEINSSINQIEIETQKLQATLQHIADAQEQGRPADAILIMLSGDPQLGESLAANGNEALVPTIDPEKASEALPFSSAERRAVLMELQIREQELLDTVGEGHPSVATIRRRIELLDRQISALADSERRLEAEKTAESLRVEVTDMTPDEKLQLWRNAMAERVVALGRQEASLRQLADKNETESKNLQEFLTKNRLLNSELSSVQQLLDGFNNTLNRIHILPESNRRTLETLTPAETGGFYGPALLPYLLSGTMVGFLCVAGLALLVDWLDQSFRGPNEITTALGLPILGHVPQMALSNSKRQKKQLGFDQALCTVSGVSKEANESYRSIRTSLYFSETGTSSRVIQITSPAPGDGKSTLASNLAVSIAQSGRSVLLIDADLRRPRLAKIFGVGKTSGIAEVVVGQVSLDEAVTSTSIPGLSLLATATPMSNPSEIVSHQRFHNILEAVRKSYDYVIIDTPPVLAVADACAVAARVDGVLLTLRLRRDAKPSSIEAASLLQSVGAHVLGVVVNGVTGSDGYNYGYNNYGYESDDETPSVQVKLATNRLTAPATNMEEPTKLTHQVH